MNDLWIIFAFGVFNIIFGLSVYTKNFRSTMFFKVIPFLQGLFLIWYSVIKHQIF